MYLAMPETNRPAPAIVLASAIHGVDDDIRATAREFASRGYLAAALMGFCYSGPYAIVGSKRLGYHGGIACHGTRMIDFIDDAQALDRPLRILWGDQDEMAQANVLDAYRLLADREENVELHVFPRVRHGYMMRSNTQAFDRRAYDFSMECAFAMLDSMR